MTTGITYMRTGQYYLNQGGPYADFFPKVLAASGGRAYVDYAFHLAPMMSQHINEIPALVAEHGVTSFKIFMFYGGYGLHGASADQRDFLMIPDDENYDNAHFEFIMRGIQAAREAMPELADDMSLSLHCETAEIMRAYQKIVQQEGRLTGLEAYSATRPPHSEGLAVTIAAYLAHETGLPNINLLHLSSAKALEAALVMRDAFPHIDFRREVTIGHLLTDFHTAHGLGGKVNPPLRSRADVGEAVGARPGRRRRLGRQRPRLLPRRDQVRRAARRRLRRQVGVRRHRVPAAWPGQRGQQARAVVRTDRSSHGDDAGRALRPAHQGCDRGRL